MGGFFGKKLHNLNNSIDVDYSAEISINKKAYSDYKNSYIKKEGSPDKPFWSIVANRLKEIGHTS